MKKLLLTTASLLAIGSMVFAATNILQPQEPEMPKPTAEHKALMEGVGTWEGNITMYVPGMPETPSPAREVVTQHGPFWTQSEFTSEFMGQKYMGHGCIGYDPATEMHQSTWVDNMSSYLSIMRGELNEEGNLVMKWKAPDMTGAMAPHRNVTVRTKDAYTMTFYTSGEKTMVIDMKRVPEKKAMTR